MKIYNFVDETINPEDINTDSLEPKDELNPDLWNKDGELNLYIRKRLLEIAKSFIEWMDTEGIEIKDVILTGSMANYNYDSESSDLDLHIIIDFDSVDGTPELVKKYFDSMKNLWNEKHSNITIKNHPVELYVQSDTEEHKSSGIYSLLKGDWIEKPDKGSIEDAKPNLKLAKKKAAEYMNRIDYLRFRSDSPKSITDDAKSILSEIKEMRKSSLKGKVPEMSQGNLTFKILRREGYMKKLIDIINLMHDRTYSIT